MSKHIPASLVMELRKRTGVGMGKCKDALVEANGNLEEAGLLLRKKGMTAALGKGQRETNEGTIGIAEDGEVVYLIEINAETDFATQNARFLEFTEALCTEVLALKPDSVEAFSAMKGRQRPELTIEEYRTELVHSLGENVRIGRITSVPKPANGSVGLYRHGAGQIVSVVVLKGSEQAQDVAREVAMHVAAGAPDFLKVEDVPPETVEREREIARSQVQDKPSEIREKIVEAKLKAYYEQVCLLNQKYVKDPSVTVSQFVKQAGGGDKPLEIVAFVRWEVGGGR
ncbi:MAG: translation elongation factor Ts [Simkaniaceae bacterium]|nr:translation elongation factor Ts [Simkaniaceae bacterium]